MKFNLELGKLWAIVHTLFNESKSGINSLYKIYIWDQIMKLFARNFKGLSFLKHRKYWKCDELSWKLLIILIILILKYFLLYQWCYNILNFLQKYLHTLIFNNLFDFILQQILKKSCYFFLSYLLSEDVCIL